jgi:formylmethanofuran dehydrogenase subunit E
MVKVLEEDSSEKNNKEIAESIADKDYEDQEDVAEKCESCGVAVPKTIATATRKQTNGKTLCLNCLKKAG